MDRYSPAPPEKPPNAREWTMPRKTRSDAERLAELDRKRAALDARRQALRALMSKKARARDTRRKVLLGAFLLDRLEGKRDPEQADRLRAWLARELPGFLSRDIDRALFGDLIGDDRQDEAGRRAERDADRETGA